MMGVVSESFLVVTCMPTPASIGNGLLTFDILLPFFGQAMVDCHPPVAFFSNVLPSCLG